MPELVTRPVIDDAEPDIGDTISVTTGAWSNSPASYTYQWKRDGVDIGGATANSYVVASVAGGLSCYVTAHNAVGSSAPVRADSGLPRKLFIAGDSLTATPSWVANLATLLGAGWVIANRATSGWKYEDLEPDAQAAIDPNVEVGWSVVFFFEYANEVTGLQGPSTGLQTYDKIEAFGLARQAAGATVIAATAPYDPANDGAYDATQCKIASDLVRTNYADFASGFAEFFVTALNDSIQANDDIHWTSEIYPTVAAAVKTAMDGLGLEGYCGDIPVSLPVYNNLRRHLTTLYFYDPVTPLPSADPVGKFLHITGGPDWVPGYYYINGKIEDFSTVDGPQRLYLINVGSSEPANDPGGDTDGEYNMPLLDSIP